jgi:hypothetical protein
MFAVVWVLIFSFGLASAFGEPRWIQFESAGELQTKKSSAAKAPQITRKNLQPDGLTVKVSVPGLLVDERSGKGAPFSDIDCPTCGVTNDVGKAKLPVIRTIIKGSRDAKIKVHDKVYADKLGPKEMKGWGVPQRILPVQPPIPKVPGAREAAPFVLDEKWYGQDEDLPGRLVNVKEIGIERDQKLFFLEIFPVQYNPAQGTVSISRNIEVQIEFVEGNLIDAKLMNDPKAADLKAGEKILIVYASSFSETSINNFVTHKQKLGFEVTSVSTATIGKTAKDIKDYIKAQYENVNTRPDFVILVGDTNTIPYYVSTQDDNPSTDLYYVTMDGTADWQPDMAIGRIAVRTNTELENVFNKTLYYENASSASMAWSARTTFMAGYDNYDITEGTHNYVIANFLNARGYTSDKLYQQTYGATTAKVLKAFNNGRALGIYSGHGSETQWVDGPPVTQANVSALTNRNMYPFVGSFACLTGRYEYLQSFGETWLRKANGGALAFFGSSVTSYWDEDDILEKRLFQAIYADGLRHFGIVTNRAKQLYLTHYGTEGSTRRYFEQYNLLGDPSAQLLLPGSRRGVDGDFNTDGKRDLIWYHKPSGGIYVWYMKGIDHTGGDWVSKSSDPNWEIVGTGDFNSDGQADLLWYEKQTGGIFVWYMNGITHTHGAWVAKSSDTRMQILGTDDFNGDGQPDLLWHDKQNGGISVWYMNGASHSGGARVADSSEPGWEMVGTGDFNSDGQADLLWYEKQSGGVYVWFMNGVTHTSGAWVVKSSDTNRQIVGTGDFNRDGKTDLLWHDKPSSGVLVWYMKGVTHTGGAWAATSSDPDWELLN